MKRGSAMQHNDSPRERTCWEQQLFAGRKRFVGLVSIAVLFVALGLSGCGSSSSNSSSVSQGESTSSSIAEAPTSDAPPEVNAAVLSFARPMYQRLAQSDPTFTGPSVVDAALCNSAGTNAIGTPLYDCVLSYDGGTNFTDSRTWSYQGNAGAVPESGTW